ncbi:hypothetical protein ABTM83_20220, partial [Acinetobacter baumannii]
GRWKLWDLSAQLHCSILGTCLTVGELRAYGRKVGLPVEEASDHRVHGLVVSAAGRGDQASKLLHKLLDRKFAAVLGRFDRAG